MKGSAEFTTWIALAFAASLAGLCWTVSSSPVALVLSALVGAGLGVVAERAGRRWLDRRLEKRATDEKAR